MKNSYIEEIKKQIVFVNKKQKKLYNHIHKFKKDKHAKKKFLEKHLKYNKILFSKIPK